MILSDKTSAYFNLLKTVLGGALIKYPYLFKTCGLTPIIITSLISITFSFFGLILYTKLNETNNYTANLSSLSNNNFFVNFVVSVKSFLVYVLYLKLLNELIFYFFDIKYKYVLIFTLMIFVLPLIYQKNIDKLKIVNFLGILAIIVMIVSTFIRYIKIENVYQINKSKESKEILNNLGLFVFGYTCHQNIFTVQSLIKEKRYFNLLLISVLLSSMLIYFSFGLLNYKIFGNLTQENILLVLPQDLLGNIVRIFYGISLLFTIPLQILPCRYYLSKIIGLEEKILSAFIFLLSFLLIICEVKIQILFNLAGGIFSSLINFVFPAFFFLRMRKRNFIYFLVTVVTILFGVFNVIFTIYFYIINLK